MGELLAFGETMLRLSPPQAERLETTTTFDVEVGGAESNVAVAASRLGSDVRWLSRIPDSPLGRRVETELGGHGVRLTVSRAADARLGTYYLEAGTQPRGTNVVYDRADSAFANATVETLPDPDFEGVEVFHTSGITPGVSDASLGVTETLLGDASRAGVRIAFDLNYRAKLWDRETARDAYETLLPFVDVLFAPERDVAGVLDVTGTPEAQARTLATTYDIETVVLTLGSDGAFCRHRGEAFDQPAYETETLDPVGSGDAFVGGFLAARLSGDGIDSALQQGAATAALKRTIGGDVAVITPAEVGAVIEGSDTEISR